MYNYALALILFVIPAPTIDAADVLNIDNPIIYYDLIKDIPCVPYLVDDNNAYYCDINDTIYYGNMLSTNNPPIVKYFALAHEDGHSEDQLYYKRTTFQAEQFADCYGGSRMKFLYDNGYINTVQLQQLSTFIHLFPASDHGTAIQRYAAFARGYLHNDC